jgi:hypothetical protein
MTPGMVASVTDAPAPTVYTVLAQSARSHSRRYLAAEAVLAGTVAALVVAWQPRWWSVASLALGVALYASWGLVAHRSTGGESIPWPRLLRGILAGLATAATLAGLGGLAVKAFWGSAPGPYGMCYEPDGSSYTCHADGSRRPASRPHP